MYIDRVHIRTTIAALGLVTGGMLVGACGDDTADAEITARPPTTLAAPEPAEGPTSVSEEPAPTTATPTIAAPTPAAPTTAPAPTAPAAPAVVDVHTADYGFGGVPASVAAGTSFRLVNDSEREVHEVVAVRLADAETRSVHEIVHAGDIGALFAGGAPHLVIVAGPNGGEQIVAEGDGTLSEPGRYAFICMIPTGADPAAYFAAAAESQGGPPQVEGGAPHIAHGMYAELVVTAA